MLTFEIFYGGPYSALLEGVSSVGALYESRQDSAAAWQQDGMFFFIIYLK